MELFEETMILSINEQKRILLLFNSIEKGVIERICIPYNIAPSNKYKNKAIRFHFYDLNPPKGETHNLSILPTQILKLEKQNIPFEPKDYISWKKMN